MKRDSKPYIIARNTAAWLNAKLKRENNSSGIIKPTGEHCYILEGQEITAKEFNEIFPVVKLKRNINQFGKPIDGRQIKY